MKTLHEAIGYAAGMAYTMDADAVVGRIEGRWQVAHTEDVGRQAQMQKPTFLVHSDGVDQGHIDRGEITEDWELPDDGEEALAMDHQ